MLCLSEMEKGFDDVGSIKSFLNPFLNPLNHVLTKIKQSSRSAFSKIKQVIRLCCPINI